MKWKKSATNADMFGGWTIWSSVVDGKKKFTLRYGMVRIRVFDREEDAKAAVKFYEEES